jgi:tetratricopeptide (TPR) repeat protein
MFESILLTILTWLTYWGIFECGLVSDDIEGLQHYDGKLKKFDYGHLNKWLLYKLLDKSPRRNHIFSVLLHNANVLLLFYFLTTIVSIKVALFTAILFAVHPVCVQSIGWISGRGYPISLFFCLLGLNLIQIVRFLPIFGANQPLQSTNLALSTILYSAIYYLSITAQFATLATFAIQAFLSNYYIAIIGFIISCLAGLGIINSVIKNRTNVFKEQNLAQSTTFKLSKIIVAIKSLAYYTRLCVFPKRMGLYHTFNYHYDETTEKEDKWFWLGFLLLTAFGLGFWFGNYAVRFAIIWYFAYIFIFLNWITIHQFVSERYVYIPVIGICLLMALVLQYSPIIFAFVVGLYLMRTWVHLPTYQDEVLYYQSNIWNFPDSEVAFSNLGVTYLKLNLTGSAMDMWAISVKINPNYDVGYYNLSSVLRQKGDLVKAREYLLKAVSCPSCHFKDIWDKELKQLDHELAYITELNQLSEKLNQLEKDPSKTQEAINIKKQLEQINNLHKIFEDNQKKNLTLIQQEEDSLKARLTILNKNKEETSKPLTSEKLIEARDKNFMIIKATVSNMYKAESNNAEIKS